LQEPVPGAPLTAEQRPLFFRHAAQVPKGSLAEEDHAYMVEVEADRAKRQEDERWVAPLHRLTTLQGADVTLVLTCSNVVLFPTCSYKKLRNNIEKLHAEGMLTDDKFRWWTEFFAEQEETDWLEKAGGRNTECLT
jgi:hypothetical protein